MGESEEFAIVSCVRQPNGEFEMTVTYTEADESYVMLISHDEMEELRHRIEAAKGHEYIGLLKFLSWRSHSPGLVKG